MLQAMIPTYIMPFFDSSRPYKAFINSPLVAELDDHEQGELSAIMISRMRFNAITVDDELTKKMGNDPDKGNAY